jgi:hypothetical protein
MRPSITPPLPSTVASYASTVGTQAEHNRAGIRHFARGFRDADIGQTLRSHRVRVEHRAVKATREHVPQHGPPHAPATDQADGRGWIGSWRDYLAEHDWSLTQTRFFHIDNVHPVLSDASVKKSICCLEAISGPLGE